RCSAENHLAGLQRAGGCIQQWIADSGGKDFGAVDKASATAKQVSLGVERASHPEGKAGFGSLLQNTQPLFVVVATAEQFDFQITWVAQQFVLQLADHSMLEPEQQQQRGNHSDKRSGDA